MRARFIISLPQICHSPDLIEPPSTPIVDRTKFERQEFRWQRLLPMNVWMLFSARPAPTRRGLPNRWGTIFFTRSTSCALRPDVGQHQPDAGIIREIPAAKSALKPLLMPLNVEKTMAAPVTAIVANDLRFYEHLSKLFPHVPAMKDNFAKPESTELNKTHAFRNATLQGAYLIIAARALGLDCGPMSGFDNAKVDAEFFPDGRCKSNFLINLGYGDSTQLHPRNPRLDFDEACKIV